MSATSAGATTPEKDQPDLEVISPSTGELTIRGIKCRVNRLKTREILLLLRVFTRTFGENIGELGINLDDEDDETASRLAGILIVAIPEGIEEFIDLFAGLVEPVGKLNDAQRRELDEELRNPDPDVAVEVIDIIVEQEKDDLKSLLGKVRALWSKAGKAYSKPKRRSRAG